MINSDLATSLALYYFGSGFVVGVSFAVLVLTWVTRHDSGE